MTFDDDFDAVDGIFAEVFGTEEIVVVDPAGESWTYDATAGDERVEYRKTDRGTDVAITREIYLEVAAAGRDTGGRPEVLNLRGVATVGELTYAIERVTHSRSGAAVLHVIRIETGEKSRDGYRRRGL